MTEKKSAYLILHFCVLIWGFTAVLGGLISLRAVPLVWWRVALSCAVLVFLFPFSDLKNMSRRTLWRLFGIGILIGFHWLGFYGAIKLANASVAVVTMAFTSFFAAFTEPFFLKTKFRWYELLLGVLVLPGMLLVVQNLEGQMLVGFGIGILSALLCAIFSVLNKRIIEEESPPRFAMMFVEMGAMVLLCSALMPAVLHFFPEEKFWPQGSGDWLWLVLLAVGCTVLPFYLSLGVMRHVSAFTINLALNLEPVYGVVLAGWLLNERRELNGGFYMGVSIILLAVFSHPFLKKFFEKTA